MATSRFKNPWSPKSKVPKSDEQIDWSKQGVKKLKNDIRKLASRVRGPEPPKILFMGETGSGKSSFISSIVSALKGSIIYTSTVGEKEGHEVNTSKRYLEHRVFMDDEDTKEGASKKRKDSEGCAEIREEPLNFVLCDSRGLAKRNQQGAADEEIERLIDGKLRHGDLIEDERSFDGSRISDREPRPPCCVVFVQKAQRLGEVDLDVKDKLHRASMLVRERGIPSCVVLTHIDQVKTKLDNTNLHLALTSTKIHERVKTAAHEAGVNENRVFVVKNYTNEHRTHTRHDVLILRALRGILVDVEQRDRDKHALARHSSPPTDSGYFTYPRTASSQVSSRQVTGSDAAFSGPSTSVSRQLPAESMRMADERNRRSQQWVAAHHQRQISAPVEPRYAHQEVMKPSLSSGELPRSFEYHIGSSPHDSQEDSKSDKDQYMFDDESGIESCQTMQETMLQEYINRLPNFRFPESYCERAELRGAKPLCRPVVYQLKITSSGDDGLCQQLVKEVSADDLHAKVKDDLQTWSDAKTGALWMSDTLPVDLGLPIDVPLPESIQLQALLLAPGLPPFVLTVCDPECILENRDITDARDSKKLIDEEAADVQDYTAMTSKLLTTALFNYCHCDFIMLPVVVDYKQFCVDTLEAEVRKQQDSTRRYYGGPSRLTTTTYAELKAAATAVCSVSHVPRLLRGDLDCTEVKRRLDAATDIGSEEPLYLLDPDWQGTVSLLIEKLTRRRQPRDITSFTYADNEMSYFKMRVAVMEAAKRLSFAEDVVLVSKDMELQECCRLLKAQVERDTGLELTLSVVTLHSPDQQDIPSSASCLIVMDLPDFLVKSDGVALHITRTQSRMSVTV